MPRFSRYAIIAGCRWAEKYAWCVGRAQENRDCVLVGGEKLAILVLHIPARPRTRSQQNGECAG